MTNCPIKMLWQELPSKPEKEVLVYDFMTNLETMDTFALCWVIENENWLTTPIYLLTPVKEKKALVE
jgi:hypothetical protein